MYDKYIFFKILSTFKRQERTYKITAILKYVISKNKFFIFFLYRFIQICCYRDITEKFLPVLLSFKIYFYFCMYLYNSESIFCLIFKILARNFTLVKKLRFFKLKTIFFQHLKNFFKIIFH